MHFAFTTQKQLATGRMARYGIQYFWRSVPESRNQGTNPPAGPGNGIASVCNAMSNISQSPSNAPVMPSQPASCTDSQVSDGEKAGATLLFSGAFLSLVGMTFTAMGWANYNVNHSYEWTQLLGPVLLSVGGMFVLISVCKFQMLFSQTCKQKVEGRTSEMEPLPPLSGPSFVFSGLNQPITFHSATVVQYIPPSHASLAQNQSLGPVDGLTSGQQSLAVTVRPPPQYYSMYPMENLPFYLGEYDNATAEEWGSSSREVREVGKTSRADSFSPPPTYEELFATSSRLTLAPNE